jgi:L-alanine-DL-glutamate epimerase-like enolase superfamily enzyme
VENVTARAYTVATDFPEADGTLAWDSTTMVVVTVSSDGLTGTGYTYGPAAAAVIVEELLADRVLGRDPMALGAAWAAMAAAARNAPRTGTVSYAISAVDVALWDLKARLLGVSLVRLLGQVREEVEVYGSGGFTTYDDPRTVAQLESWTSSGIEKVKIKIGEDQGRAEARDLHRLALVRETVGPDVALFADANGAYHRKQAVRVAHAATELGLAWFEEPVSSDDLLGLHEVRSSVECDVTAGEYGTDAFYFQRMCAAGAVDCLQIDATRCGGYSEWLRSAAVAHAHGLEVSAHCAPNLHAHVAAATPNARHVEWFHDHVRIESMLFQGVLEPVRGRVRPDEHSLGHGLSLDTAAADQYLVRP